MMQERRVVQENYKEDYLGFLDGIRGVLAFWVFFSHLQMACTGTSPPWGSGAIAVDIFMLLSGFLMAYHWRIRENRFNGFKTQTIDFYLRRFFRIAPLYYVLLLVALIGQDYFAEMKDYLKATVPPPWQGNANPMQEVDISNVFMHYTFLFGFIPKYANSNILPDWSIGLEMQFYLLFPFIVLAVSRFGAFSVVFILIVISFATNKLFGLYLSPGMLGNFPQPSLILFKINIFAAGMAVAFIYLNRKTVTVVPWVILGALCLYNAVPQVWAATLFIVFMLNFNQDKTEIFGRLMSSRLFGFLGDTSYSVYLSHLLIITPVLYMLFHNEWFMSLHMYSRLLVALIVTGIPIYLLSYMLFRLIELRGIRFGRKTLQRMKLTVSSERTLS